MKPKKKNKKKVTVSLNADLLALADAFAKANGFSRSCAMNNALSLLKHSIENYHKDVCPIDDICDHADYLSMLRD